MKPKLFSATTPRAIAAIAAIMAALASFALAVDIPTNGTGGGNWTTTTTWLGGDIPDNSVPDEDALVKPGDLVTIDADQTARHLFIGDDGDIANSGGVNMTAGTLTLEAIYIGTDLDVAGAGATPGNGYFNFIDGTINLAETGNDTGPIGGGANSANSIDQALEISSGPGSIGVMNMGDGTTNPTLTYTGGRFEVGGASNNWGGLPVAPHNATFNFRSGTITGSDQNLIIGQNNQNTGTATMTMGGGTTPATFSTTNDMNMNRNGTLTLNSNSSLTGRDFNFATNNNTDSILNVNAGATLTVNRAMEDRAGTSTFNLSGGTVVFNNTDPFGTANREREVEALNITDGSNLAFAIGSDVTNAITPLSVNGDDAISSTLSGDITLTPVLAQSDPSGTGNTATADTWTAGDGTWDTTTPDDLQWDLGFAPENAGAISVGRSFFVLGYATFLNPVSMQPSFPFGGQDNLTQGNADGEFDVTGLTSLTSTDGDWSVTTLDQDVDGAPEAYSVVRANTPGKTPPATAVFNSFSLVTAGTGTADLVVGRYVGADAGALQFDDIDTFTVTNDFIIGGAEEGVVSQGVVTTAPLDLAVVVNGDLIFGNDGTWDTSLSTPQPQGGIYNLNEGTLTVSGDIVEGEPGLPDEDVDNAQLQINTGTIGAQALSVTGTVTVQRFAVAQEPLSVAGMEISGTSGVSSVTTSGTVAIGEGVNAAKDGDPGILAGADGTIVVGSGGTLTAGNIHVAADGDSVGALTIDSGGTVVSNGLIYIAGDQTTGVDDETVGTLTVNAGGSLTVVTGNTEIGRDGDGTFTVDGGTYIQQDNNLVLGQNGNVDTAEGTAVFTNGATVTIGVDLLDGDTPSFLNINDSGGTVTQTGNSAVSVESNLNMALTTAEPSSYSIDSGTLTVGGDFNFRSGTGGDGLLISGTAAVDIGATGDFDDTVAGSDLLATGGAADNNLVSLTGSTCSLDIWDDLRADGSARFKWVGDAGGVATIRAGISPVGDAADTTNAVVQLNNAILEVDLSSTPPPPGVPATPNLVLIENVDATGIVLGTFAGLPEGANVGGTPYAITYAGGNGNDVALVVSADPDADGDGMLESYELANGLSDSDPTDAASDNDGDGFNALFEFIAGTLAGTFSSSPVWDINYVSDTQVELIYGPITPGVTYNVNASLTGDDGFPTLIGSFDATIADTTNTVIDATGMESVELYQLEVLFTP